MINELDDYIIKQLDEFISHYETLEELVEHKKEIHPSLENYITTKPTVEI